MSLEGKYILSDDFKKEKIAKRIVKYSEIYKNDFAELVKMDLKQLEKLQSKLLIGLRIKFAYKLRNNR